MDIIDGVAETQPANPNANMRHYREPGGGCVRAVLQFLPRGLFLILGEVRKQAVHRLQGVVA